MMVMTGPMSSVRSPSASRRRRPRSTASAAASAWATLKLTVQLTLTPRYVASSITSTPTCVAGNFTMMLGASEAKWTPCASIGSGVRKKVGFVCIERRPLRPPNRSNVGRSRTAPTSDISSTIAQARSTSVHAGCSPASAFARARQRAGSFFQTSWTIVGLAVAPTAPNEIAYSNSSTSQESFQMSVGDVATVRPSGLCVRSCIEPSSSTRANGRPDRRPSTRPATPD
jgi:hypothetical protein